ncbi:MAG: peptide chain release factor N(5)-glutamine methyltransferase [Pseudomonadota bacterium]
MTKDRLTFGQALAEARGRLTASPTAALDARVLLEYASRCDRAALIAADHDPLPDDIAARFASLTERRRRGEPVAYITGRQAFWEHTFAVGEGVLIPRPETEQLVETALSLKPPPRNVLDLGTGSGCLLLSILHALPDATGVGIDASPDALAYAQENRARLALEQRADLKHLAFDEARTAFRGVRFDLIVANPPYIPDATELPISVADFEPKAALFSGDEGLDAHRACAAIMAEALAPEGSALIEIGHDQGTSAPALYADVLPGRDVRAHHDAKGLPRMVAVGPVTGL